MNNGPTTPQGYGPPPGPPPPHAGYGPPPRQNSNKWMIIVVLLVIGLPVLLVLVFAVAGVLFFATARSSTAPAVPAPEAQVMPETESRDAKGPVPATDSWLCIRVIDGDTIEVVLYDKTERVRLLCIDTPERGQPGYDEATQALRELVEGYRVDVVRDPEHDERDNFGRLLGYVIFSDHNEDGPLERLGLNVNVEMVRLGHSENYTKYGASSMYDSEFREAAQGE